MFFIEVLFENNKIKFKFNLDFYSIEKNTDNYFNEIEKVKNYTVNYNQDIDFETIINEFNKFKIVFAEKFFIDKKIDNNIQFIIYDDYFNENNRFIDFIKNYKNINIVLHCHNYNAIIENLKDEDFPNLKINFQNSYEAISYKDFYDMYKKLDEIIKFIEYYDLSPLEKVFLVYDIVKANIYNKEEKYESYGKSRDLNQIINCDKIVCVGYANLINYLLTNLGIKNDCIITYNKTKKVGHQKNYLYLDDEKYGIKGVYFLDVTADSRKNDNYIDNYRCFLKSFDFLNSNNSEILKPKELSLLTKSNEEIKTDILDSDKNYLSYLLKLLNFINVKYSLLALISQLSNDSNTLIDLIELVKKEYNSKINPKSFKTALYKVRRIEYINNITQDDLSIDYIEEIYKKNFIVDQGILRLLKALNIADNYEFNSDLANIESIESDSLRMRFLKDLKIYLNDIPNNDFIKKMRK